MLKFKNWSKKKKIIVGVIVIILIGLGSNQSGKTSNTKTKSSSNLSKDDLFVEFQVKNSDSILNDNDLTFLLKNFGEPIEVKTPVDSEKFEYININSFWGPFFSKDESLKIIEEYGIKKKEYRSKLFDWLRKTGPISSENRNWESYKTKMEKFSEPYKKIYNNKTEGRKVHIIEIVESYSQKYPEKSYNEILDEFDKLFRSDDNGYRTGLNVYRLTNTVYKYKTQEKVSLLKYYQDDTKRKDFEIDIFRTLTVTLNGKILNDSEYNSSFCISDQARTEIERLLTDSSGDWSNGPKGNLLGSYRFFDDGTYRMANKYSPIVNGLPKPTIGNWWINCSGEIVCSKQPDEMIITESGILNGQTLYTKYN